MSLLSRRITEQFALFGESPRTALPKGFLYQPEVISRAVERTIIERVRELPPS